MTVSEVKKKGQDLGAQKAHLIGKTRALRSYSGLSAQLRGDAFIPQKKDVGKKDGADIKSSLLTGSKSF